MFLVRCYILCLMPELPEVETTRLGLLPALQGAVIKRAEVRRHDLRGGVPADMVDILKGARVKGLERRGKYMIMPLVDSVHVVIWHLGMSGRARVVAPGAEDAPQKHDHVVLETEAGFRVIYNDARRFGMFYALPAKGWEDCAPFNAMGPEPLGNGFNGPALRAALTKRKGPIKTALLDQRVVAGLGNIYVCEALFRAGISPLRRACDVTADECESLVPQIKAVLADALEAGGSSLRDYRQASGQNGYFQHKFDVYDREGEPCSCGDCSGSVERIVQAGRSTFYCEACQT